MSWGFGILVDPPDQLGPVIDGASHISRDDEVELERVRELALHIVDLEREIRRGPLRLLVKP